MSPTDIDQVLRARFEEVVTPPAETAAAFADIVSRVGRRRRRRVGARVGAVLLVAAVGVGLVATQDDPERGVRTGPAEPTAPRTGVGLLTIGWREGPQITDLQTGSSAPLAADVDGSWQWCSTCPIVQARGRFFTAQNGRLMTYVPGEESLRDIGMAQAVMASSDGRRLWVWTGSQLEPRSLDGEPTGPAVSIPAGFEPPHPARSAGGGFVIAIHDDFLGDLGWWHPDSSTVHRLGRFNQFLDAFTGPADEHALLAWTTCPTGQFPCSLRIERVDRTSGSLIGPPVEGNGYYGGGAFSPDGRHLALVVSTSSSTTNPAAALGILEVGTHQVEVVAGSEFAVEPRGSVAWSPDSDAVFFPGATGVRSYHLSDGRIDDLSVDGTYAVVAAVPALDRRAVCPGAAHPWQLGPVSADESGDGLPPQGEATRQAAEAALDEVRTRYGAPDASIWAEPGRVWSRAPNGEVTIVDEMVHTIVVPIDRASDCPELPSFVSGVPLTFITPG